jgi:predicted glycoside hydrolase/deacetylase ChbG (UPF0249 family)
MDRQYDPLETPLRRQQTVAVDMTERPMNLRYLIVNADDFGQTAGINQGIIDAHEHGIVTSASLMVRWPAAREAARYARSHPSLSVGLHLDLGEWRFCGGGWSKVYEVAPLEDVDAVRCEAWRQLTTFRLLTGSDPTHVDSHQHIHRRAALAPIFLDMANELGIPLRGYSPRIRYYGGFYGQDDFGNRLVHRITVDGFVRTLGAIRYRVTELGCHPGYDGGLDSMYCGERVVEVETLCDPAVRAALAANSIELRSFVDWAEGADRLSCPGAAKGGTRLMPCVP